MKTEICKKQDCTRCTLGTSASIRVGRQDYGAAVTMVTEHDPKKSFVNFP